MERAECACALSRYLQRILYERRFAYGQFIASPFMAVVVYCRSFNKSFSNNHENAKKDFFNAVNKGARWTVFFGHGHPDFLCDEKFLNFSDYPRFQNDTTPTIFFTFSCRNGDFLRQASLQMNKSFLFKPSGGCLAYFAATVDAYSDPNKWLASAVFNQCNGPDSLTLGKAVTNAFCSMQDRNMLYYHILGDPAVLFRKRQTPLATSVVSSECGDITIATTTQSAVASPLFYSYRIALQNSIRCLDDSSQSYSMDSVVTSAEGIVSGPITTIISSSLRNKNAHYSLYVWNNGAEARFDTVISATTTIVADSRILTNPVSPLLRLRSGALVISLPASVSTRAVKVRVITIRGELMKEVDLPFSKNEAVFDYARYGLAQGNYLLRISSETRWFSGKICLLH